MSRYDTTDPPRQDRALVTAAEWFGGGQRIPYDPESARVLTEEEAAATTGVLRVFERVAAAERDADTVWLTLLPGFPDGSYGWAQVDGMLGDDLGPRLYVEPVGQGDSDKPRDYLYSTVERANLVEALWRHHRVRLLRARSSRAGRLGHAGMARARRAREREPVEHLHGVRPAREASRRPVEGLQVHAPAARRGDEEARLATSPRRTRGAGRRAR